MLLTDKTSVIEIPWYILTLLQEVFYNLSVLIYILLRKFLWNLQFVVCLPTWYLKRND
jgi:hypothetical protein